MYKDIISYELAPGITEEHLIKVAREVVKSWMTHQQGFVKWEICKTEEGQYTDIVHWVSKEDAEAAEKKMNEIPTAAEWWACYKSDSISSKNLTTIKSFE